MDEPTTNPPSSSQNSASGSVHGGGRRRGSRRRRKSGMSPAAMVGTVLAVVAVATLAAFVVGSIVKHSSGTATQRAALQDNQPDSSDLRTELKRMRAEMDTLVKQRLPRLKVLQFDKVIPMNQPYVRSVLFTVTRSGDKESYEYTIILENVDSPSALPVVQVLLFDRTGVQVGGDRVEGAGMLRPGDKQTFSGEIPLFMDATPEYFYVDSGKR
ncbi:MAG TPA: hypothetical protein PKZ77_02505 [Pseudomonadales bacterium]|nr:hypothetical protein [Pseudomonadales bacterium]HNC69334.1 hypothetical protein [Pseudomonadales bacterium]